MTLICQACELCTASIEVKADDPGEPYLVCQPCHSRLMSLSLRPLEWFNLAKRHGWAKFLLHDDFYEQTGEATQPEEAVEKAELFASPTLEQVQRSATMLLNYSVTRWSFDENLQAAWLSLPASSVVAQLRERFGSTRNTHVRSVVLQVAATLQTDAAPIVKQAWKARAEGTLDDGAFWSLAKATAACLPRAEGLQTVIQALEAMPRKPQLQQFGALAHFRSTQVLDWIEAHASEPSVPVWGDLAAASEFSWPKAEAWFKSGRPLSLMAIDALLAIAEPRSAFLRQIHPTLADPPSELDFRKTIEELVQTDPVPRVKQRTTALLTLITALTSARSNSRSDEL